MTMVAGPLVVFSFLNRPAWPAIQNNLIRAKAGLYFCALNDVA